jgi:hypothetical protein
MTAVTTPLTKLTVLCCGREKEISEREKSQGIASRLHDEPVISLSLSLSFLSLSHTPSSLSLSLSPSLSHQGCVSVPPRPHVYTAPSSVAITLWNPPAATHSTLEGEVCDTSGTLRKINMRLDHTKVHFTEWK